ncbi:MAG: hypothetical protein WKG01_42520 [Kofleriaceae bacterium]
MAKFLMLMQTMMVAAIACGDEEEPMTSNGSFGATVNRDASCRGAWWQRVAACGVSPGTGPSDAETPGFDGACPAIAADRWPPRSLA